MLDIVDAEEAPLTCRQRRRGLPVQGWSVLDVLGDGKHRQVHPFNVEPHSHMFDFPLRVPAERHVRAQVDLQLAILGVQGGEVQEFQRFRSRRVGAKRDASLVHAPVPAARRAKGPRRIPSYARPQTVRLRFVDTPAPVRRRQARRAGGGCSGSSCGALCRLCGGARRCSLHGGRRCGARGGAGCGAGSRARCRAACGHNGCEGDPVGLIVIAHQVRVVHPDEVALGRRQQAGRDCPNQRVQVGHVLGNCEHGQVHALCVEINADSGDGDGRQPVDAPLSSYHEFQVLGPVHIVDGYVRNHYRG